MAEPVTATFRAAVAAGGELRWYVSVLDPSLQPILTGLKVEDATQVQVNDSIVRRTGTVVLHDQDGLRDVISPENPWRLQLGLFTAAGLEHCMVMTGWLAEDREVVTGKSSLWTIPLRGREYLGEKAQFLEPTTFLDGMPIAEFAGAICGSAGMGSYGRWDDGGARLDGDHTYEEGVRKLDAIDQVCRDNALDFAADPWSALVLRPFPDPETAVPIATYRRGRDMRLVGFSKTRSYQPKNVFIVKALGALPPVRAVLRDDDPASRWSTQKIGEQPDIYGSAGITRLDQAYAVARMRFAIRGAIEETIEMVAPPDPSLDALDTVSVVEGQTGTSGKFLLRSLNVVRGAQTLSVRRVRTAA